MKRKPNSGSFKPGVKRGPRPDWVKEKLRVALKAYYGRIVKKKDIRPMKYILSGISRYRKLKSNHIKNNSNCFICGKPARDTHHIIPLDYSLSGKKALRQIIKLHIPTNLISVCVSCHSKIHYYHGNRNYFKDSGNRFKSGYDKRRYTNKYQEAD